MTRKQIGQLMLVVVLVGVSLWQWRRHNQLPPLDLNPYQALGAIAAEETSTLLGHQGDLVLVLPDPGPSGDPVMDSQVAEFKSGLKRSGRVSVRAVEPIQMDPFTSMRTGGAVPPDRFAELRRKHPNLAAWVFFIGFPPLDETALAELKAAQTKNIVVSAALPTYQTLLDQRVIHLALVPRSTAADPAPAKPANLRAAFDQEYEIWRAPK